MQLQILVLRLVLALGFGAFGNFIARANIPPNAPFPVPIWTNLAVTVVFGIFGATLPDIFAMAAKRGLARLAEAITSNLASQITALPKLMPQRRRKVEISSNPIVLDTSVLIDGRIEAIVEAGFIPSNFILIPSVLAELQHIADSADDLRRAKGRRGLTILENFKKNRAVKLQVYSADPEGAATDDKLVNLAKKLKASILSCDYNLAKAATIAGIKVLNVNNLAHAVRAAVLPGEIFEIKVVNYGKSPDQGVGYLLDGTMVVVEEGAKLIGKTIEVKVRRSLQTLAGKMVFGEPAGIKKEKRRSASTIPKIQTS